MEQKIDINWHNLEPSSTVEADIRKRFTKLHSYADDITKARISLDQPHHPSRKPHSFHVMLELHIPGTPIIAHQPPTGHGPVDEALDIYLLIHRVFDAAQRQLLDHNRLKQGRAKQHAAARRDGPEADFEIVDNSIG